MRSVVRIVGLLPVVEAGLVVEHAAFEEHAVGHPGHEDPEGGDEPVAPVLVRDDGDENEDDQECEPGFLRSRVPHYF